MYRVYIALAIWLACLPVFAAEVVAQVESSKRSIAVVTEGNEWQPDCLLDLVETSGTGNHRFSLKRPGLHCSLFGPTKIALSDGDANNEVVIVIESVRGGDGDHTGPLVEVFSLAAEGFSKRGELELYDVAWLRDKHRLNS